MELKSHQEVWKRELALAQRPDYWKSFVIETRECARSAREVRVGNRR